MRDSYPRNASVQPETPPITPEQDLLIAIMERAIRDAVGYTPKRDTPLKRDALGWLISNSKKPFSSLWVCDQLKINRADFFKKVIGRKIYKRECPEESRIFKLYNILK